MRFEIRGLLAVTLACVLAASHSASAAFMSAIADDAAISGSNDTVVTDQGVGDNFPGSATAGQINSGAISFGGFTIITNVAQSKPAVGSATVPQLTLTFTATSSDNNSHTIYLYASDTDFTAGAGTFQLSLTGSQPGTGSTVTGSVSGGSSNTNFDTTQLLATTGASTASPFALNIGGTLSPTVNPFSLTLGVVVTRTSAGTSTGELQFTSTPEPASLGMIATLTSFAIFRRRRSCIH